MANKRELKKTIHLVCENLMMECLAIQDNNPAVAVADIENIAKAILMMQNDFVNRLSHVDKTQTKRFFAQLDEDFAVSTNEVVDMIYQLM